MLYYLYWGLITLIAAVVLLGASISIQRDEKRRKQAERQRRIKSERKARFEDICKQIGAF